MSLVGLILASALASQATSGPDVGDLEGDWLQADFAQALASGEVARHDLDPLGPVQALMLMRQAGRYRVRITNHHEALDLTLRELSARDAASWTLHVAGGSRESYDLTLQRDDHGRIQTVRAALWSDDEIVRYQRVEPDIATYVNHHLVAGRYVPVDGRSSAITDFRADGTASWQGQERRYSISLDQSEAGCRYLTLTRWPHESMDDQQRVGFRWHDSELQLFEVLIDDGEATGFPIHCAAQPFARLHAVRGAAERLPLLQPLSLRAAWDGDVATYVAHGPSFALRLPREAAVSAAMDFTENDGLVLRGGASACAIPQDDWFSRSEFWSTRDGSLLALALRSASGGELRVIRVADCTVRAKLALVGDVLMQTGRVVLPPTCEKTSRHVWLCRPAQVWRLSGSGELRKDVVASVARSKAELGFSLDGPGWFARVDGEVRPVHESQARRMNAEAPKQR